MDFPLLDLPYNSMSGARAASMQQSLDLTASVYDLGHRAIARAFGSHTRLAKATIMTVDFSGVALPFADAWLHEEWHRATLGNRRVDSRDDVYVMNLVAPSISVSHVTDEALATFKLKHPPEFVRLKEQALKVNTRSLRVSDRAGSTAVRARGIPVCTGLPHQARCCTWQAPVTV